MTLPQFVESLAENGHLDLRGYKHSTLARRLRRRMMQLDIESYEHYYRYLISEPGESAALLDTLLINVTHFFRDPEAWNLLREQALPLLFRDRLRGSSFRAWVAGCSTGEEVYSLAMLIADFLGERLREFEVRIYATDVDDSALNVARRGEYPAERLQRLPDGFREKYFTEDKLLRVNRDIRRLVIFGRSDLVRQAPISRVDLLLCRNVLIYFDQSAQRRVFDHFQYSVVPGGVLFLGKAESQLADSETFSPLDARWRIFVRTGKQTSQLLDRRFNSPMKVEESNSPEASLLASFNRAILDVVDQGVIVLDSQDNLLTQNRAAERLWNIPPGTDAPGTNLLQTALASKCSVLSDHMTESRQRHETVRFTCRVEPENDLPARTLEMVVRPVFSDSQQRVGTLIYIDDVSHRDQLKNTIQQLEATGEELHSANEELETTNEELQSTNEELETTNEELQSTNEELETTNEELQSLNEELENMNEELEFRSRELDTLNTRYADTLEQLPWAVTLVDDSSTILFWNSAAQRLFNLASSSIVGLKLEQLPIPEGIRNLLQRRHRSTLESGKPSIVRGQNSNGTRHSGSFDIHFTPLLRAGTLKSVLIMFSLLEGAPKTARASDSKRSPNNSSKKKTAKPATKKKAVKKKK